MDGSYVRLLLCRKHDRIVYFIKIVGIILIFIYGFVYKLLCI